MIVLKFGEKRDFFWGGGGLGFSKVICFWDWVGE